MFATLILMAPPASECAKQPNPLISFVPLLLIIVIMYFLLLRPQAKRQKELRKMLDSLEKGDRVLTVGGIIGTIQGFDEKENTVILKIAENVKVEATRSSIAQVLKKA